MDVTTADWVLLVLMVGLGAIVYVQGSTIQKLCQVMAIQAKLNTIQNDQIDILKKKTDWVDLNPVMTEDESLPIPIDKGFLFDPNKPRRYG